MQTNTNTFQRKWYISCECYKCFCWLHIISMLSILHFVLSKHVSSILMSNLTYHASSCCCFESELLTIPDPAWDSLKRAWHSNLTTSPEWGNFINVIRCMEFYKSSWLVKKISLISYDFRMQMLTSLHESFIRFLTTVQRYRAHVLSGVASGWHGWTMSRGPSAKGGPERQREKEEKEEKKRKRRGRGPGESIVHGPRTSSLCRCMFSLLPPEGQSFFTKYWHMNTFQQHLHVFIPWINTTLKYSHCLCLLSMVIETKVIFLRTWFSAHVNEGV